MTQVCLCNCKVVSRGFDVDIVAFRGAKKGLSWDQKREFLTPIKNINQPPKSNFVKIYFDTLGPLRHTWVKNMKRTKQKLDY